MKLEIPDETETREKAVKNHLKFVTAVAHQYSLIL